MSQPHFTAVSSLPASGSPESYPELCALPRASLATVARRHNPGAAFAGMTKRLTIQTSATRS